MSSTAPTRPSRWYRPSLWTGSIAVALLLIATAAAWLVAAWSLRSDHSRFSDKLLANYFAYRQDIPAAAIFLLFLVAIPFVRARPRPLGLPFDARAVAVACLVIAVGGWWIIFGNYPLSLDEYMATFDARIFAHGALLAPLPPDWRGLSHALQPDFLAAVPGDAGWASGYLPVNAMLRALFGLVGGSALTSPVLAAASLLLLDSVARKLVPDDPRFAMIAVVLLFTSSQFLITAMTPYAMTAHLAFNLAWLRLILSDRKWAVPAAAAVTFAACGLHQMAFHPLFVAPFLPWLFFTGRRVRAILLAAAVGVSLVFWASYPAIVLHLAGIAPPAGAEPTALFDRIQALVRSAMRPVSAVSMAHNLARLLLWQNPLTWVLFAAALCTLRRQPAIVWAMLGGLLATIAAMCVLMPIQGHGWGYRYVHGLLGSLALIGAYGWRTLEARRPELQGRMRIAAIASVVVALAILFPLRAYQAHAFTRPYQRANAAIDRSDADIVIIEERGRWYGSDLVRNDPWLRNRPIRLLARNIRFEQAQRLCRTRRVILLSRSSRPLRGLRFLAFRGDLMGAAATLRSLRAAGCG